MERNDFFMHIQIIDGEITYYSPRIPVSSHIETNEEIDQLIKQLEEYVREQRTPEQIAIEQANEEVVQAEEREQIATTNLREVQTQLGQILETFPTWNPNGVNYSGVDQIVRFEDSLYRVLQPHTSQADWRPDQAPSLFVDVTTRQVGEETGEIQEWEQPGSTNPYNTGDKVRFEGDAYESTIDGNVWSPATYPQGWRVIEDEA